MLEEIGEKGREGKGRETKGSQEVEEH